MLNLLMENIDIYRLTCSTRWIFQVVVSILHRRACHMTLTPTIATNCRTLLDISCLKIKSKVQVPFLREAARDRHEVSPFMEVIRVVFLSIHAARPSFPEWNRTPGVLLWVYSSGGQGDKQDGVEKQGCPPHTRTLYGTVQLWLVPHARGD